jgi:4-carboxymuconolactone decarboxylase
MTRISAITKREGLTEAQKKAYDAIVATRGSVRGPFTILLHSPELCERTAHVGTYLRYESQISHQTHAVAALITGRIMDCQYEFTANTGVAKEAGVSDTVITAIRDRKAPEGLSKEEALVFQVGTELLTGKYRVSPETFKAAMDSYGVQGLLELISTFGYYSHLCCILNAFEMEPKPGYPPLPL